MSGATVSQYPFRKSFLFKFVAYFFLCIIYQEQNIFHNFSTQYSTEHVFLVCMFYTQNVLPFPFRNQNMFVYFSCSFSRNLLPRNIQLITFTKHRFIIQKNVRAFSVLFLIVIPRYSLTEEILVLRFLWEMELCDFKLFKS